MLKLGQADQRAQEAQRGHQPRQRVGKGRPARAVHDGVFVDVVFHLAGVVVHTVGEEQVVQIIAPVGIQRALAQEIILLPGVFLVPLRADAPDGPLQRVAVVHHRGDAPQQPDDEQRHDGQIHQQVGNAAEGIGKKRLKKTHTHLRVSRERRAPKPGRGGRARGREFYPPLDAHRAAAVPFAARRGRRSFPHTYLFIYQYSITMVYWCVEMLT